MSLRKQTLLILLGFVWVILWFAVPWAIARVTTNVGVIGFVFTGVVFAPLDVALARSTGNPKTSEQKRKMIQGVRRVGVGCYVFSLFASFNGTVIGWAIAATFFWFGTTVFAIGQANANVPEIPEHHPHDHANRHRS